MPKCRFDLSGDVFKTLLDGSADFGLAVDEIKKGNLDEMIPNLNIDKTAIIEKAIKLLGDQLSKLPKV